MRLKKMVLSFRQFFSQVLAFLIPVFGNLVFQAILGCMAFAQAPRLGNQNIEAKQKLTKPEEIKKSIQEKSVLYEDKVGFVTFLGLQGGYTLLKEGNTSSRKDKSGYLLEGDFLASWYPKAFVLDAGISWQYSSLSGEDKENESDTEFTKVKLETQAPLAQLAVMYRFTEKFQFGIFSKILFAADVGFDSSKASSSPAIFIGPQIAYGVPEKLGDIRFFANGGMSLNLVEKTNFQFALGAVFGVPWIKPDTLYKEKNIVGLTERTEKSISTTVVPRILFKQVSRFAFNQNEVVFKPRKAVLGQENQKFLIELSIALQESQKYWQELTLEYFVPASEALGEEAVRISAARAAALKNALVAAGLPAEILRSRSSAANLANVSGSIGGKKSREVESSGDKAYFELVFANVNNENALNDLLSKFKMKYQRPETCKNDVDCK